MKDGIDTLLDCLKWSFMGAIASSALKEAGKENDPEAVAIVKNALQNIYNKEHPELDNGKKE
jgi:hypothetical protein